MKHGYLCLGLLILPLTVSCAENDAANADQKLESEITRVIGKIDELTSDLGCDNNEQCLYIEYGHKPCGGPAGFRIFSSRNTDVELINAYADELFRLTREYNQRHGLSSNCMVEKPPALRCETVCKEI